MKKTFALMDGEIILHKSCSYRELATERNIINSFTKLKSYVCIWLGRMIFNNKAGVPNENI